MIEFTSHSKMMVSQDSQKIQPHLDFPRHLKPIKLLVCKCCGKHFVTFFILLKKGNKNKKIKNKNQRHKNLHIFLAHHWFFQWWSSFLSVPINFPLLTFSPRLNYFLLPKKVKNSEKESKKKYYLMTKAAINMNLYHAMKNP